MRFLLFAVSVCLSVAAVFGEGHYSIIAPGTIHADRKYNVAIGVHDVEAPCQLKVGITGPSYNDFKTIDLKSNELKTLDFDIPYLNKDETYNLTAEGISGLVFKNTTKLNYEVFKPYIKFQTDKGKYKPGDIVNFRVLFLDENLRPSKLPNDSYIYIEDEKRNRIKEYKNIKLVKGVYTGEFELSEFARVGTWRIIASIDDTYYNPQVFFSVEKYVLPKYSVIVEATEDVSVRDGDMQAVVRANYTYGKPVNGKVTLVITMINYYNSYENSDMERKPAPAILRTTDMVEGKAKFNLNIKEYADYMPQNSSSYSAYVTATVEEQFTGVMINGTTYSTFYPYRYKIECIHWSICSTYYKNKESELPIKILHVDNSKVDDIKSPVKLHFTEKLRKYYYYNSDNKETAAPPVNTEKKFTFEAHLNASSIALVKINLDDLPEYEGYDHYYEVKAEFTDETHSLYSINQYREPKYVQREVEPEKPPTDWFKVESHYEKDKWNTQIGKETRISINSSVPMPYFVYHIIGRGNVLHTDRIDLSEPNKLYNLTIIPTFMMAPHSSVYVYFVDNNGEFRYGETSFSVDVVLPSKIEIVVPKEVKPGSDTALTIKTPAHSFVGLLAVDQSVLLLGNNNDLSTDDFRWRLSAYGTNTPWQGGYSRYPGEYSGLVTLTNADYFYNWTKPEWSTRGEAHIQRKSYSSTPLSAGGAAASPPVLMDVVSSEDSRGGFDSGAEVRVRKDFSETWLFTDIEDTPSEEFTINKQIPDTITSWVVSAFSLNEKEGLGVVQERSKIRTFQPFFISLRLPYAVKRGEVINIPSLVFNYLEKDLDVNITLDNSLGEYEFVEASNEVIVEPTRVKTVRVPANSARGVSFMIRPTMIGNIMLKYTAISPIAGDAIHKTLKVVPEGVTEYANRAYFVNLKDVSEFKETFELALPKDVVPDSQHIEFGVVGDLLGPVLNNLENLLRMPLGCGEQVTSTMIPNYMLLNYLNKTNHLTPNLERKIKRNLETGYQHILYYRNDNGSFSSFGWLRSHEKRNGSTWLTAYVVRTLSHITPHVKIDEKIIKQGFEFLVTQQADNGSFVENGDHFYSSQNQHVSRTAGVLLAFLENEEYKPIYQAVIDKALNFIEENVKEADDVQTQALVAYVLHQAKHEKSHDHITALKAKAKSDEDRLWWSDSDRKDINWWRWVYSSDVETTSYILLVLLDLETENTQSVLPIVRWLVAQRNSYGGFSSTHDTVVGLQALIKFVEKSGYEPARMTIDFSQKGSQKKDTIQVTENNALLLQTVELSPKTQGVDFHATGTGAALVQVAYQYNVVEKDKTPSFKITTNINRETPVYKLEMDVCVEYTGEGEGSNMAVLEVSLPSGYVADVENFEEIEKVKGVRLTETKNRESVAVIYFDSLHKNDEKCVPVIAYRQFPVAMQKPASVVIYDYYDTSRKATEYYEIESKLCEICDEDEECKKKCQ